MHNFCTCLLQHKVVISCSDYLFNFKYFDVPSPELTSMSTTSQASVTTYNIQTVYNKKFAYQICIITEKNTKQNLLRSDVM
jgi:hypothetical protein